MKTHLLSWVCYFAVILGYSQTIELSPSILQESHEDFISPFSASFENGKGSTINDNLTMFTLPSTGATSPFSRAPSNYWKFQRTQYLITAAEMLASGFPAGANVSSIGFYVFGAGIGNLTGTLKVYLMNTSDTVYSLGTNWTIAGFTMVDSTPSWSVPITTGIYDIPFSGGTTFSYTGGGLYIAWEFSSSGTTGTSAVNHYCNTLLTGGLYGYRSSTSFPVPTGMAVSDFRPATRLGSTSYEDIIAITNIYTLGKVPVPFGVPQSIKVRVANVSTSAATFDVTLNIKDQVSNDLRYTSTQTVTGLASNGTSTLDFTGWMPEILETDSVIAFTSPIPGETWTQNNNSGVLTNINVDTYSYNFSSGNPFGYGFTYPNTGIFAAKFTTTGLCKITGANLVIANASVNIGDTIYAVLLNSSGTVLAQSSHYVIQSSDLGTVKNFTFSSPVSVSNDSFFIGMAQTKGTSQWYPLGTFLEEPQRGNSFYLFPLGGGAPFVDNVPRRYGCEAVITPCIAALPFAEGFDGAEFPPECWITEKTSGSGDGLWERITSGTHPIASPHSGAGMTRFNSYDYAVGTSGILVTPPVILPGDSAAVNFWMYRDDSYPANSDLVKVYFNTSPGLEGASLLGTVNRSMVLEPEVPAPGWCEYAFAVPYNTTAEIGYFILEGVSDGANDLYIDDVSIVKQPHVYHSISEVYSGYGIQEGDTVWVGGYYTNPQDSILIAHYGDWIKDEIMAPHSFLMMEGVLPPANAYNGGYILAKGIVHFEPKLVHLRPADSMIVHLNVMEVIMLLEGEGILPEDDNPDNLNQLEPLNKRDSPEACDPCKFAILISGGWDNANNHSKYWENLVALYNYKVNNAGYCPENVLVNYFKGTRRDNRIPSANVKKADSANVSNNFEEISKRVAACTKAGTPATFQKMITNHGESDGEIDLVDPQTLDLDDLKAMEQKIIDSCCTTMYDEFLECYGGHVVDKMETLDNKNKTTIYINSNADHATGISTDGEVHSYLQGKIDALVSGKPYPDAVVDAKLAYDAYLQAAVDECHQNAQAWRNQPPSARRTRQIALWVADSAKFASRICQSRNVTIAPFKYYCEWKRFVVPPGGQLVIDFTGENTNCGNVTVYKVDPSTGQIVKVRVFNWNLPGSARYTSGNEQRVINASGTDPSIFWIHNDNGAFNVKVTAKGNQNLPESVSNAALYPGFSFGGSDNSHAEFGLIPFPTVYIPDIDQIPLPLSNIPGTMGAGFTQVLGFSFQINPTDIYWTDMQLHLDLSDVISPGLILINSPNITNGVAQLFITEPGVYTIPLGDMTLAGPLGNMQILAQDASFSFDSWGLRSLHGLPKTLNINVFLESLYAGNGLMNTAMDATGPHFGLGIADKVTVELHNPADYAQVDYIAEDVDLGVNGSISVTNIPAVHNGAYYLTIKHRNSIETTSALPVSCAGNLVSYDFSSSAMQAFGGNLKLMDTKYCIFGGDPTQDGLVDASDLIAVDNDASAFAVGYIITDVNGDGLVDSGDMIMVDNNASQFISAVLP